MSWELPNEWLEMHFLCVLRICIVWLEEDENVDWDDAEEDAIDGREEVGCGKDVGDVGQGKRDSLNSLEAGEQSVYFPIATNPNNLFYAIK